MTNPNSKMTLASRRFQNAITLVVLILATTACSGNRCPSRIQGGLEDAGLLTLRDGELVLGIWPDAGGRVVHLSQGDSPNLLHAAPKQWRQPIAAPAADAPWRELNGHIMWVGPQKQFWTQQDRLPTRRDSQSPWPPDPYMTLGRYRVVEASDAHATLIGPVSPISGLQLTKRYELLNGNEVRLDVAAVNRREQPVQWGLWSNTRINPEAHVFAPLPTDGALRLDVPDRAKGVLFPYCIVNQWFYFEPRRAAPPGSVQYWTKAFIDSPEPVIAAFVGRWLFIKRRAGDLNGMIHPDQAAIELFRSSDRTGGLCELEMHGAYTSLDPSQSMQWSETWRVVPLPNTPGSPEQMTDALQAHIGKTRNMREQTPDQSDIDSLNAPID